MSNHSEEKKAIYKKWWFWLLIVIAIIVIIGVGGNSENTTVVSQSQNGIGNDSSQNSNNQITTKKVNVGETVQTNQFKITYLSAKEYTGYNQYSTPKSGNKVIRVEFSFENISNNDIVLNTFDCYADGEKCENYYYADDMKTPALESLSKGKKLKAVLYYEVPKTAKETVLEYETNLWSDEKIEFIVK